MNFIGLIETFIFVHMCSVQQVSAGTVKQQLEKERVSVLETFDVKFTDPSSDDGMAIDLRIKFEHDRPVIVYTKKNEAKALIFDVLSLHRYIYMYAAIILYATRKSCFFSMCMYIDIYMGGMHLYIIGAKSELARPMFHMLFVRSGPVPCIKLVLLKRHATENIHHQLSVIL